MTRTTYFSFTYNGETHRRWRWNGKRNDYFQVEDNRTGFCATTGGGASTYHEKLCKYSSALHNLCVTGDAEWQWWSQMVRAINAELAHVESLLPESDLTNTDPHTHR